MVRAGLRRRAATPVRLAMYPDDGVLHAWDEPQGWIWPELMTQRTDTKVGTNGAWLPALRRYLTGIAVGNLVWEFAHMPLYTIWSAGTRPQIVFAAVHCTGGDVLIGLSALTVALMLVGTPAWPRERFGAVNRGSCRSRRGAPRPRAARPCRRPSCSGTPASSPGLAGRRQASRTASRTRRA